ncbi:DinB family protein [Zhouia spongiae]|uniref:DinB family protein n=1 Tax=Zhouia spongiae TaxID=2202721 RepID=A0ABY3YPI8_9FLAO|nr:DinB family protein [Zhouia spongiae]UNY99611.1 DinB family protein [Zhouia spongiae]
MKKLLAFTILFIAAKGLAQNEPVSAFLEKWENSKNYLVQMVDAMPADAFSYKPSERQMTFSKQLQHIQQNMVWLGSEYFHADKIEIADLESDKKLTIESIKKSFDIVAQAIKNTNPEELKETVKFFAGPKTKLQILNLLQDHVTHHRGQLIVYLNLNNIEPPRYVGW